MEKEEKIKEVYGELYEGLRNYIDINGWVNQNKTSRSLFHSLEFDEKTNSMRPLKLKGIEKNNGWIKIESESDLPKDNEDIFVFIDNEIYLHSQVISLRIINNSLGGEITHYQPIQEPQPPIY